MKKRGIGYGSLMFPLGLGLGRADVASAVIKLNEDGTINVLVGVADIGQGSDGVMAMIAAEILGIKLEDVNVTSADTEVTPSCGPTTASRATYTTGNAVKNAALELKQILLESGAELLGANPESLTIEDRIIYQDGKKISVSLADAAANCYSTGKKYVVVGNYDATTGGVDMETGQGDGFISFTYGTQVAEVEVDTDTGEVEVLRIVAAHDAGRAINPISLEGQIEGGVAMGVGQTFMEKVILDHGKTLTPTLAEYLVPTVKDVPEIVSLVVEELEPSGPFGAKGVAEPPTVGTAPAIINAIYDAVGIRITELPATPEKVRKLLKEKGY